MSMIMRVNFLFVCSFSFLAVLAEHGGLNHVETIAKKFVELTMAHKGIVEVNVTSVIVSSLSCSSSILYTTA